MPKVWGYVLEGPRRPKLAEQRETLAALGVDASDEGTVWHDKIKKGSTRPRGQLVSRNDLVRAAMPGDTVVVAAPFCLGVSRRDAAWFLSALGEKSVTVIVTGGASKIEPGDDASEILAAVASAQNVANVYRSTGRLAKSR